jgi:hypothetical protein
MICIFGSLRVFWEGANAPPFFYLPSICMGLKTYKFSSTPVEWITAGVLWALASITTFLVVIASKPSCKNFTLKAISNSWPSTVAFSRRVRLLPALAIQRVERTAAGCTKTRALGQETLPTG